MKIETSDIKMNSHSAFNIEQKQSSAFVSHVINSKKDIKDEIAKDNYVKAQITKLEKVLLSNENDLAHQDKINKNILEIILNNFTNEKDFKFHPKDIGNRKDSQLIEVTETNFKHKKEYHQSSSIEFSTQAQIKTNRGQININLNLSFSQNFSKIFEKEVSEVKTKYIDPLIINYKSELTSFDNISNSLEFEFDLNSDGKNELIPVLKEGAGFLALDKNENKKIDNGNELFGANTGNGFSELKEYDEDKNSWIDESDSIFNKLLIWQKDEKGNDSLIALGEAGIGAIYLSAIDSSFTYSKDVHENYALLKQSSIYLKEDGEAGLVTSVDFTSKELK